MEKLTKREKIMLGITIVAVGTAGVLGYIRLKDKKLLGNTKDELKKMTRIYTRNKHVLL